MIAQLLTSALAEACSTPTTVAMLDEAVARAEIAMDSLDVGGIERATDDAEAALRCLAEPVGSDTVARWYRARAVHRFVSGQADAAAENFRAARALQPAYVIDPELGVPIREAYAAATPGTDTRSLPAPVEGWFVVDGRPGTQAPADRPYVAQWFGSDGAVRGTWVVPAGGLPGWPVASAPVAVAPAPVPVPAPVAPVVVAPVERRGHVSRDLALAGVATGLVAGVGIAYSAALQDMVLLSDDPSSELAPQIARNRAVGWSAGALGVGAIGLGVTAVVVGRW